MYIMTNGHKIRDEEMRKLVVKVRSGILLDQPFYGSILMRLILKELPPNFPYMMGTDGKHLWYHPERLRETDITIPKIRGVMIHEAWHIACLDHLRQGKREARTWNMAADFIINNYVKATIDQVTKDPLMGKVDLPSGLLYDPKTKDFSIEQLYMLLPKEGHKNKPQPNIEDALGSGNQVSEGGIPKDDSTDSEFEDSGKGFEEQTKNIHDQEDRMKPNKNGNGENGQSYREQQQRCPFDTPKEADNSWDEGHVFEAKNEDGSELSDADRQELEQDTITMLAAAAFAAKQCGKLPIGAEILIGDLTTPKFTWREILNRFMSEICRDDYSFKRPNPRYMPLGFYVPDLYNQTVKNGVIVVDMSGSIGKKEQQFFCTEAFGVLATYQRSDDVLVVYYDSKVTHHEWLNPSELPPEMHPKGGGGTAYSPIWKWLEDQGIEPEYVLNMTDGYCNDFGNDPGYPVLWVMSEKAKAGFDPQFGEVITLDYKNELKTIHSV